MPIIVKVRPFEFGFQRAFQQNRLHKMDKCGHETGHKTMFYSAHKSISTCSPVCIIADTVEYAAAGCLRTVVQLFTLSDFP